MKKEYIKWGTVIGAIAVLASLIYYFDVMHYLSLETIKHESSRLRAFVAVHYHSSVLIFAASFIFLLVIGIPSTIPLVLLSGYLFGAFLGALYAACAAVIGSAISFLLFRYYISESARNRFEHRFGYLKKQIDVHGSAYLLVLHYTSVVPFFVINMLAAIARIPLRRLLVINFVGAFPIYCIFASAGRNLSAIHTTRDIFSPSVIVALILLVGMALASVIFRTVQARRKKH